MTTRKSEQYTADMTDFRKGQGQALSSVAARVHTRSVGLTVSKARRSSTSGKDNLLEPSEPSAHLAASQQPLTVYIIANAARHAKASCSSNCSDSRAPTALASSPRDLPLDRPRCYKGRGLPKSQIASETPTFGFTVDAVLPRSQSWADRSIEKPLKQRSWYLVQVSGWIHEDRRVPASGDTRIADPP